MFGVEPICKVLAGHGLEIATSPYYAVKNRTPSARSLCDAELKTQISSAHADNFSVYGARTTGPGECSRTEAAPPPGSPAGPAPAEPDQQCRRAPGACV